MDIQFYGANCVSINYKSTRIVIDDNLTQLGKKSILKPGDVALFTSGEPETAFEEAKIVLDSPGEYEVADISIVGIPVRSNMDDEKAKTTTMFKLTLGDINILITGHVYPRFSDSLQETIGICDVLIVPVGGHGYSLDPQGALTIIKEIEPKLIIPTHYEDSSIKYPVPQTSLSDALKEMAMEPKETVAKLKLRYSELSDVTQLIVLETS